MMTARQRSRLYYIIPLQLPYNYIIKLIEARRGSLHTALISGRYGEFTNFFRTLEDILLPDYSSLPMPLLVLQVTQNIADEETVHAAILLVMVTEVEARVVLDYCPKNKLYFSDKRVYHDLGMIGDVRTFMTQSEMGSDRLSGSRFTVDDGWDSCVLSCCCDYDWDRLWHE